MKLRSAADALDAVDEANEDANVRYVKHYCRVLASETAIEPVGHTDAALGVSRRKCFDDAKEDAPVIKVKRYCRVLTSNFVLEPVGNANAAFSGCCGTIP